MVLHDQRPTTIPTIMKGLRLLVPALLLMMVTFVRPSTSFLCPYLRPSSSYSSATDALSSQAWRRNALIEIVESDFPGAGEPRPDLAPEDIPPLLMTALSFNDFPTVDAGLKSVWAFAGDTTRFIFQNNETDFIKSAHETAKAFPTSFYGNAMNGKEWELETPINRVGGETGWIATQVMKTISSDGRLRRWQWELRKQKRPPNLGCWYVENIGSSDRKGQFEPE